MSVQLCFYLRHKPEQIAVDINREGWVNINQLIANWPNGQLTEAVLLDIVATDEKNRYSISSSGISIRANQGHSNPKVSIVFKSVVPPAVLYHGTGIKNVDDIMRDGINKKTRQFVHLSDNYDVAIDVGRRHGIPTVFEIDTQQMIMSGHTFYISDNGVYLVDYVSTRFISQRHIGGKYN